MADAPLDERGLPHGAPFHPDHELAPRDAARLMRGGLVIVDIREPDELVLAPFPGAMHIPMGRMLEHPEDLEDELPDGRATPIALICHLGSRSLRATLALRQMGFTDVRSVAGGTDLWSRDIDRSVPRYER